MFLVVMPYMFELCLTFNNGDSDKVITTRLLNSRIISKWLDLVKYNQEIVAKGNILCEDRLAKNNLTNCVCS